MPIPLDPSGTLIFSPLRIRPRNETKIWNAKLKSLRNLSCVNREQHKGARRCELNFECLIELN